MADDDVIEGVRVALGVGDQTRWGWQLYAARVEGIPILRRVVWDDGDPSPMVTNDAVAYRIDA